MTSFPIALGRRLVPLLGLVMACGLLASRPGRADRLPDDPVEQFKQALLLEYNKSEGYKRGLQGKSLDLAVNFRQKNLTEAAKRLKSLGDISQALLLLEWPVAPKTRAEFDSESAFDRRSRAIEAKVRAGLTKDFVTGVQKAIKDGRPARQLAVANLVGETAATAGDLPDERLTLFEGLAPLATDLATLTRSKDARVRAGAARALGQFPAKPDIVTKAMQTLLANRDTPLIAREAAADALVSLVQVVSTSHIIKPSEPGVSTPTTLRPKPFLGLDTLGNVSASVAPVAAVGLDDPSVKVRRGCAQALRQAASTLAFETRLLLPLSRSDNLDPPTERDWSAEERAAATERRQEIASRANKLRPAFLAMSRLGKPLLKAAKDDDATVRLEVRRTLEALAQAQRAIVDLKATIPAGLMEEKKKDEKPKGDGKKDEARAPAKGKAAIVLTGARADKVVAPVPLPVLRLPPPLKGALRQDDKKGKTDDSDALLRKLLESVADGLVAEGFLDPRASARRASVEAIEASGATARKYIPQLIRMTSDKDVFVRWIAARTLGAQAPASPDTVVPALAAMLKDEDLDARGAAARALGQYGPAAKAAVPTLGALAEKGDPELRLIVLKALEDIGTASTAALPSLVKALGDLDPRVREKSARLIGRFGTRARDYASVLQKLINDPDSKVRREAGAALLAVEEE